MKEEYLMQIAKELEDCIGWMTESSAGSVVVSLDELIKDTGDTYEVIVDIHLKNGDVVTLHNNCIGGLEKGKYVGDYLNNDFKDGNIMASLCVNGTDGNFHQMRIPLTSISWIDSYVVDIDWEEYKKRKKKSCGKESIDTTTY